MGHVKGRPIVFVSGHNRVHERPIVAVADPSIRLIALTMGKFAIVNAHKYAELSKRHYHAVAKNDTWYAARNDMDEGRLIFMHQDILPLEWPFTPDHENGNGLDNRIENLRPADRSQQAHNKAKMKSNTSGYKGVYYSPAKKKVRGPWEARIYLYRVAYFLGHFYTREAAARAYDAAAIRLHGEFACINFPEEHGLPVWRSASRIYFTANAVTGSPL